MIYVSNPAIISAAGANTAENMSNLTKNKRFLSSCEGFRADKNFILAKVSAPLVKFSQNTPQYLQTRTNALVLSALCEIEKEVQNAIKKYGKHRVGVVIGTTTSGVEENYETFKDFAKTGKFDASKFGINRNALANPSEFIAHRYALSSPAFCISTACTSGVKAIINAKRLIEADICDAVICGGVDSLNTLTINGFDSLGILSERETNPFSKNRDGINIGEGVGLFVLSREQISDVVIAGAHSNCDAFHMTQPDFSGVMQSICVQSALRQANLNEVDYLNLHGTATVANDKIEAKIVHELLPNVPASSTKPFMGHTLGAAGAIESAVCVMLCAQEQSVLPPHIYDGIYDDELERVNLVKFNQMAVVNSAMSLSFAFGGDNAAIIFRRAQ